MEKLLHERLREGGFNIGFCSIGLLLDADGVPIEVGDTVWSVKGGIEHRVLGFSMFDDKQCVETKNVFTGSVGVNDPNLLTHREPDSLEKLRDDMVEFKDSTYCSFLEVERPFERFIDRLDALLERDA